MLAIALIAAVRLSAAANAFQECKEQGFCVHFDETDINDGFSQNGERDLSEEACLAWCEGVAGSTGCERIINQGNEGCYVFTSEDIHHGNGVGNRECTCVGRVRIQQISVRGSPLTPTMEAEADPTHTQQLWL
jgi:hypothetical protein